MKKPNRGFRPAFPFEREIRNNAHGTISQVICHEGLTIQEEFAKAAMQGLMSCATEHSLTVDQIALRSIEVADALIAKLEEENP